MKIAGFDVSYSKNNDNKAVACLSIFDFTTRQLVTTDYLEYTTSQEYIPGQFVKKEGEPARTLITRNNIDLVVFDGNGKLHPQLRGIACIIGEELNIPTIGIAKNLLVGQYDLLTKEKFSISPIKYANQIIGYAFRSVDNVKPIFVSSGYSTTDQQALDITKHFCTQFRIPEIIRQPDILGRKRLRGE